MIAIWHNREPFIVDIDIEPGQTTYTIQLRRGETYTIWTTAYTGNYQEYKTFTVPLTDEPEEPAPAEPQPSEPQQPEMDQGNDGE